MPKVTALVLKYEEPGWTERTLDAVHRSKLPMDTVTVGRKGVGSMSAAFNKGLKSCHTPYVWFLTNVGFCPEMGDTLLNIMERHPNCAAVHPAHKSDHPHLRSCKKLIEHVPFIEWTAPFLRMSALEDVGGTDENMPYWGFDLDWSARAKERGWILMVSREYELDHTYLRACSQEHDVSKRRKNRRREYDVSTEQHLRQKWGPKWMKDLWPTNTRASGSGRIYV